MELLELFGTDPPYLKILKVPKVPVLSPIFKKSKKINYYVFHVY